MTELTLLRTKQNLQAKKSCDLACNAGFSLVELLIATALGILVLGGAITAFTGSSRSSELNQSMSNMQANARFALDILSADIRMAGYQGCASPSTTQLKITAQNAPTDNFANTSITGAVVGSSQWQPTLPPGYTPPTGVGAPVEGTHVLQVQYASTPGYSVSASMISASGAISINGSGDDLIPGNLAVIANCDNGDLFEIASVNGVVNSRNIQPDRSLSQTYLTNPVLPDAVRVMPFVSTLYYIGQTNRVNLDNDPVRALFMQTFPYDLANNPPVELIEGIDQMQLSFGIWQSDNTTAFMTPDSTGFDPANINMVRVGLLMSSIDQATNTGNNRVYHLAGTEVSPAVSAGAGQASYPDDARLRVPYNTTIKVRNRFSENRT